MADNNESRIDLTRSSVCRTIHEVLDNSEITDSVRFEYVFNLLVSFKNLYIDLNDQGTLYDKVNNMISNISNQSMNTDNGLAIKVQSIKLGLKVLHELTNL